MMCVTFSVRPCRNPPGKSCLVVSGCSPIAEALAIASDVDARREYFVCSGPRKDSLALTNQGEILFSFRYFFFFQKTTAGTRSGGP